MARSRRKPKVLASSSPVGGQAADAADARPGQAGGPVRRDLPAHRLRPVERRQLRLSQGRRADAVQVAQPGPARHQDVADVDDARQLRRPGPGAAAGTRTGTSAAPTRSTRASTLLEDERPDIVVVVGADHVYRMDFSRWSSSTSRPGGRHRRGDPPADLLADQFGVIEVDPDTRKIGASARSRPTRSACPMPRTRCSPPWATTSSRRRLVDAVTKDHDLEGSKHDMGGDIVPPSSPRATPMSTTSRTTTCPAPPIATAATGATSGPWTPTTTPTWTSSRSTRSSTSTTTTGRSTPDHGPAAAGEVRPRPPQPLR
jgi:hypothetical protein